MYLAKEFSLEYENNSTIPRGAMQACLEGQHKAVNPHRQRLLVAAHKATKAAKPKAAKAEAAKPEAAKAKAAKPKAAKPKAKRKSKAKGKSKPKAKAKSGNPTNKKPDTAYNVERKRFMSQLHP